MGVVVGIRRIALDYGLWFGDGHEEEARMATVKSKGTAAKRSTAAKKKAGKAAEETSRTRTARPYPASSFQDAVDLGNAIMLHAAGERVRRLTLLEKMGKSATSSATKMMITNSGKYGITTGSYVADFLELTQVGSVAVNPSSTEHERRKAIFALAIDGVPPFKLLYDHYKGKRLPEREIIKDMLRDSGISVPDLDECVDTFIVNVKDLELLRTIGGAETLVTIEQLLEELPESNVGATPPRPVVGSGTASSVRKGSAESGRAIDWQKVCFYITPIGADSSEERKHADLFMSSLVQPALEELGLTVVRADQIGEAGMITT